jgi:ankyrin repeat protein
MHIKSRIIWVLVLLATAGCEDSIHDLVHREDLPRIQAMVERDPSLVNSRTRAGKTPLHYAVTYSKPEFIDYFVSKGSDINAADKTGLTPLHVAAMLGREEEAKELLKHGADIEAKDSFGDTPFHIAALFGQCDLLQLLYDAGANPLTLNKNGEDPYQAAQKTRREEAETLLRKLEALDR